MASKSTIKYAEIKDIVLARIRDRTWPPGSVLPTEIDLAEEFGCARATVNRALRELTEQGLLDRKRKAGTRVKDAPVRQAKFVIPLVREEVTASGATYRYALIKRATQSAPDWLRARLDLEEGEKALHLHCMHFADNAPFQFEDRWINIRAVPNSDTADFSTLGPNEWLVQQVPFTDVEISFLAHKADAELAGHLLMTVGDPVFTAERTTWLEGLPVTFARLHFAGGYRLTTRF